MPLFPLIAILIYALLHSLLAAAGIKARSQRILGNRLYHGFYRLTYNVVSAITFLPVTWVIVTSPSNELWRVAMPFAGALLAIQAFGLVLLLVAVLQADPMRFAGVSQAIAFLKGHPLPLPAEKLQTRGLYGVVRHPLYLFSLLVLWLVPVMTDTFFAFAAGATLYFLIGSRIEERRLTREFGSEYARYRERVPWLLPRITLPG